MYVQAKVLDQRSVDFLWMVRRDYFEESFLTHPSSLPRHKLNLPVMYIFYFTERRFFI